MFSVVPVIRSKRGAGSSCAEPWPVHTCYRPQRSCSKVMFLHLSVILFMGWGVCHPQNRGRHPPGRHPLPSACWDTHTPTQCMLGYTHPHPVHAGKHHPVQSMLGYGQQAGGTHPTGMHSCLMIFFV